jgi:ATP-dependent Clp protease protease subunit
MAENNAELVIYGPIGADDGFTSWYGDDIITPKTFKAKLDALGDVPEIKVLINSPGGDVFAGQAIYSMLARHSAKKTIYVDGLAASAASLIAMAGKLIMPRNAMLMIHNPWGATIGDEKDHRKMADNLATIKDAMIPVYAEKTGMGHTEISRIMTAETWLTAEEALDAGFADEIEQSRQIEAGMAQSGVLIFNGVELDAKRWGYRNAPSLPLRDAEDKTKRDAERALRDAGFGRAVAKAIVGHGWDMSAVAGEERDAPAKDEGLALFLESQRVLTEVIK